MLAINNVLFSIALFHNFRFRISIRFLINFIQKRKDTKICSTFHTRVAGNWININFTHTLTRKKSNLLLPFWNIEKLSKKNAEWNVRIEKCKWDRKVRHKTCSSCEDIHFTQTKKTNRKISYQQHRVRTLPEFYSDTFKMFGHLFRNKLNLKCSGKWKMFIFVLTIHYI